MRQYEPPWGLRCVMRDGTREVPDRKLLVSKSTHLAPNATLHSDVEQVYHAIRPTGQQLPPPLAEGERLDAPRHLQRTNCLAALEAHQRDGALREERRTPPYRQPSGNDCLVSEGWAGR